MNCTLEYIAAGGNRHSSAADWAAGLLAFGAGNNVALWHPDAHRQNGISALLAGHTDTVNAVKICHQDRIPLLISGSADATIRVWKPSDDVSTAFRQVQCLTEHANSINVLAASPDLGILASGSADGTVKIWQLQRATAKLIQSLSLKPRFIPLALALTSLPSGDVVLAAAGTSNIIQLFVRTAAGEAFELQASLSGHEGWIRSLDFTWESQTEKSDILLASASQDKYIRLWRFHRTQKAVSSAESELATNLASASERKSLSNKAHHVGSEQSQYIVTFEALLIGHEDWIYTVRWRPGKADNVAPALLSASADNSLSIWNPDPASGLWVCNSRLGEISSQKGSTTATGSAGGFWIGLWHPQGHSVVSLGRTGSWRLWTYESSNDMWVQETGISGHVQEVLGLAWSPGSDYVLTTSADQTTRLFAERIRSDNTSWHELSRPQIHGYDLNCIDTITDSRFISGADEKLLRVFDIPRAVKALLGRLSGKEASNLEELPEAANIPVLGLSNKATTADDENEEADAAANGDTNDHNTADLTPPTFKATLDLDQPPFEDLLARHTLWPEHEKLYGHGYEISTVATSNDGTLVATACKASSIDHAVIRLYETREWREVKPALKAHTLTVTRLSFCPDNRYLLSVGRDRQWALFQRNESDPNTYAMHETNPKGHTRMILDCAWAPLSTSYVFATAGRDKVVKIWKLSEGGSSCITTVSAGASVTALAWRRQDSNTNLSLAYGTEDGKIVLVALDEQTLEAKDQQQLDAAVTPSKTINTLRWRPRLHGAGDAGSHIVDQLAVASDDHSVRIYSLK